jgi:hypothetical protein
MLILNLFYDIVIVIVILRLLGILEPHLAHPETWLLDYQVRVFLFFFYYTSSYVVVNDVVTTHRRHRSLIICKLSLNFRFESRSHFLLSSCVLRIVGPWSRPFVFLRVFAPDFCGTELSSITSLNFIDEFVFHSISGLVGTRTRNFDVLVDERRASRLFFGILSLFCFLLFSKFKAYIVSPRTYRSRNDRNETTLETFANSKRTSSLACFRPRHLGDLEV